MRPQNDALLLVVDKHLGRGEVRVCAGRAIAWIGLRPVEGSGFDVQNTGLVDLPGTADRVDVCQTDDCPE